MKNESWDPEVARLIELEEAGDMSSVLEGAERLLVNNPNDLLMKSKAAAFFIDSGTSLQNLTAVEKGVTILEQLKESELWKQPHIGISLKYNLSNGYHGQFEVLYKQGKDSDAFNALDKAKSLQQELLFFERELGEWTHPALLTNYANTLDQLGRTIEAIDYYSECLRRYPKHAMAIGNCGVATFRFLNFSQHHAFKNAYASWGLLDKALALEDEVLKFSSPAALENFRGNKENLEAVIDRRLEGGLQELKEYQKHREEAHGTPISPNWLSKIRNDRLLLTLNLNPLNSEEECVDDLFFKSMFNKIENGNNRFYKLVRMVNVIKEDYATARYLYYFSENARENFIEVGAVTKYTVN